VQNLLKIEREKYYKARMEYYRQNYYSGNAYLQEIWNIILRFFKLPTKPIKDFESCFQEFEKNPPEKSITEEMDYIYFILPYEHDINTLKGILSVAHAAKMSGHQVSLSQNHCKFLNFGNTLVPKIHVEIERDKAVQELEDFTLS